jgi:hypothetical protein
VNTVSKALYDELVDIYGEKECIVETAEANETVDTPLVEKKARRLRIMKKKEPVETLVETEVVPPVEHVVDDEKPGDKVVEVVTLRVKKKVTTPVEVQQSTEESDSDATVIQENLEGVYVKKTPEEIRKERDSHLATVEAKRVELVEKGINPKTLLTRSNLEKWLKMGMSYQRIAREEVGLSERYIAGVAKNFGLQSSIGEVIRLRRARGQL